jgi:CheY-like chemotaxis protein
MGTTRDTVLVVEDDPAIREMVVMVLEGEGFKAQEAKDGAEAIRALDQHRPPRERLCLVLLDMMLPRANGEDVLHHLADRGGYVPVVAMSASRQALQSAEQAGAKATLPKPFDVDQLIEVVERCCPH